MATIRLFLQRSLSLRENETTSVLLSGLLFYLVMSAYFILRPIRDEMGIAGGVRELPRLFLVTLSVMALIAPAFGWLVRRFQHTVFIPLAYRFFALNLLVFFVLLWLLEGEALITLGRIFYVWVSVFNLFILSVFWAFLAGGFGFARSRRLFGIIAIGGTLGAILGSGLTAALVGIVGKHPLLLVSAVLLEISVRVVKILSSRFEQPGFAATDEGDAGVAHTSGQGILGGIKLTLGSTYLLGISSFLFLYTLSSTFLYFVKVNIVAESFDPGQAQTASFANIDFWTQTLTLLCQLFVTGRLLARLGTARVLMILPLVTLLGFVILGLHPVYSVLVLFETIRRASNYALTKPARETLFTLVDRNVRYKAKNFIDTFVYRGGDALGAGAFSLLTSAGVGLAGIAFAAVPLAVLWGGVGCFLGRRQARLAAASRPPSETRASAPTGSV